MNEKTQSLTSLQNDSKARKRDNSLSGQHRILVVEDEQDLQDLLRFNLSREGFAVICAENAEQALRLIPQQTPDLIVLDLMLPGMDGLEFCRMIRSEPALSSLPILMLTAKNEESDVIAGLEVGADDYLAKPFSPKVLNARIKALLRRRPRQDDILSSETSTSVTINDVTIDPERHEVRVAGQKVDLTATEFKMLSLLASKPGRVFTRQQIITNIHGQYAAVTDRSVDVQVVTLRRKLGSQGADIETVRGVGYRFRENAD